MVDTTAMIVTRESLTLLITISFGSASVISDIMIDSLEQYDKYCKERPCIMKCCPDDRYIGKMKECVANNDTGFLDFHDLVVYNKEVQATRKRFKDVFYLVPSDLLNFSHFEAYDFSSVFNNYLIEDGSVMQEVPNTYNRWTRLTSDVVCVDYAMPNGKTVFQPSPRVWRSLPPDDDSAYETDVGFVASALLISCVFLTLVLIAYSLLPELRNLCGLILMAYVASLLVAFLMLATLLIISASENNTDDVCIAFTFAIYYFFLSSFCWMNVMSFDIWWTFRGYAKARPIHRRGQRCKFGVYCAYSWGLPGVLTAVLAILDNADLRHIPWFVKPNINDSGCVMDGGSKFMYLYMPMLTVIVLNWLLFLMTAFNIWRLSRGTAVLDSPAAGNPSAHRTHRHRLMLYLKLSVVMGVSWVLEVVSFLTPQFRVWYLTDAYNLLIGVFIFLIFVCKKKMLRKLAKRVRFTHPQWSPYHHSNRCSSDSDSSQETTVQICLNPTGNTYSLK